MKLPSLRKSRIAVILWALSPIVGPMTAAFFLILSPFRSAGQGRNKYLGMFLILSAVYVGYFTISALAFGPLEQAINPVQRLLPMLILVALANFLFPRDNALTFKELHILSFSVLFLVLVATIYEKTQMRHWRPELFFGNPLNLAPMLIIPGIICIMRIEGVALWQRIAGYAGFISSLVVIGVLIQARGALLAFAVVIAARILFALIYEVDRRHRIFAATGFGVLVIVGAALLLSVGQTGERLMGVFELATGSADALSDRSLSRRMIMLTGGLQAFAEQPLFGYGPQNRFSAAAAYFPVGSSFSFSHLHNEFVTHAVAGGIIGVVLLLGLIGFPAWVGFQKRQIDIQVFQLGVYISLTFLLVGFFNNILFVEISTFNFAMTIVAFLMIAEQSRGPK